MSVVFRATGPKVRLIRADDRLMQAAFDVAVEYIHDRKQFGQAVGAFQLMQGAWGADAQHSETMIIDRCYGCGP